MGPPPRAPKAIPKIPKQILFIFFFARALFLEICVQVSFLWGAKFFRISQQQEQQQQQQQRRQQQQQQFPAGWPTLFLLLSY
jgi:hypothetical protein